MKGVYPLLLGFAVLSLVGLLLVPRLSVQLAPSGGGQNITVSYAWAGASPLMLEAQVTALLEGTFSTVQGVKKVSSVSGYGYGYVSLELDKNADADALRLEVAPSPRSDGHVLARAMWAASASDAFATSGVHDPTGRAGGFAGYEFDTRLRHWLVPARLRGEINADLFLRRGMLRRAPNAPAGATTAYFSAAVTAFF
jgi:hypothetical protein